MDLNVQITQQGLVLTWPGGNMMLADIHRVRIYTAQTTVTTDGTTWSEQLAFGQPPDSGLWQTGQPKVSEDTLNEEQGLEPTSEDQAVAPFDPTQPGADLADCIAYLLSQPYTILPVSLEELQKLLRFWTAFDTETLDVINLEQTMGSDTRFRKLTGNDWMPIAAWPPSDPSDVTFNADAYDPLTTPPNPTDLELFRQEFNPKIPGGQVADYVYYLMTNPDEALPMLTSRMLKLLKSRTVAGIPTATAPYIKRLLKDDPRFQKVGGWHWDLSEAHQSGDLHLKSAINYIWELIEKSYFKLPIPLATLAKLLERHTDIGAPRCGLDTLQSAMIRDPRFYRTARDTWQVKLTPPVPEDPPAEET